MKTRNAQWTIAFLSILTGTVFGRAADAETIRAPITPPSARKAAPAFRLLDASGKSVNLSDYRGKVVILNFWATECGGCRLEIPWFVDLDQTFRNTSAVVVGISLDVSYESLKNAGEGWSKVNPFVQTHGMNTRFSWPTISYRRVTI
jgi:thiol-disulfide isomerase/thioredoxin